MAAHDNTTLDAVEKVLSRLDALYTRMDALETGEGSKNPLKADGGKKDEEGEEEEEKKDSRKDGEKEEEEKEDSRKDQVPPRAGTGEAPPPVAPAMAADKKKDAKKDAAKADAKRGDDDDDDDDRKDAKDDDGRKDTKADSLDEMRQMIREQQDVIKRLEGRMRPISDEEHYQFAEVQSKADDVFQGFGRRAPRPLEGESLLRYRKRLATEMKKHSEDWKDVKFSELPEQAFAIAEKKVYADAIQAAANPIDLSPGELRAIKSVSSSGHNVTSFVGKDSFVKGLGRENRYVVHGSKGIRDRRGDPGYLN